MATIRDGDLPSWDDMDDMQSERYNSYRTSKVAGDKFVGNVSPIARPGREEMGQKGYHVAEDPRLNGRRVTPPVSPTANAPTPSGIDELAFRQWVMRSTNKIKTLLNGTSKIEKHIAAETDLNLKMVSTIFPKESYGDTEARMESMDWERNSYGVVGMGENSFRYIKQFKEVALLESATEDLIASLTQVFHSTASCFEVRKSSYIQQIRSMRDMSNNATRNALNNAAHDHSASMKKFKNILDSEKRNEMVENSRRLREAEVANGQIVLQLNAAQDVLESKKEIEREYSERLRQLSDSAAQAAEDATRQHWDSMQEENIRHEENLAREQEKMKKDMQYQLAEQASRFEEQMRVQAEHDDEIKGLLTTDKLKLEKDVQNLQHRLDQMNQQLTVEKEHYQEVGRQEAEKHELIINQLHAETVKGYAKVKADFAQKVHNMQVAEEKKQQEWELNLNKSREKIIAGHALEINRIDEKHRMELKRLQAQLEVRQGEEFVKIKHIHEQEVGRLLRDNDRFKKLLIRAGVGFGTTHNPPAKLNMSHHVDPVGLSQLPDDGAEPRTVAPTPSPANTHRMSTAHRGTDNATPMQSSINWGGLNASIAQQNVARGVGVVEFSVSKKDDARIPPAPPNSFPLDDALACCEEDSSRSNSSYSQSPTATSLFHRSGRHSQSQRNISSNAKKVDGYMEKLQCYLEGDEKDVRGDGDGIKDVPDNSTTFDLSAASPLSFTLNVEDMSDRDMSYSKSPDSQLDVPNRKSSDFGKSGDSNYILSSDSDDDDGANYFNLVNV